MTIRVLYTTPSFNVYEFVINIDDEDPSEYNFLPVKLHPFVYGNNDKIDSILYPDSVTFEFSIEGAGINTDSGFYTLIDKLSFIETTIVVNKNGNEFMRGYVDQMNVGGNWKDRSVEITMLGNFGKLLNIDPRNLDPDDIADPTPVNGADACAFFTEAITETIKLVMPNITQTVIMTDLKATTTYSFLGEPYDAPASNWGDFAYRIWGPQSVYGKTSDPNVHNCAQLIKNILASFGCVGIVKENKFIMQSKFYFPNVTDTLLNSILASSQRPQPKNQQKIDGLQMFVRPYDTASDFEALYGTVEKDENGFLKEPDRVETEYLYVCGGDPPGVDGDKYPLMIRKMYCYIPGFVAGIGNEIWDLAKRNECFSSMHPTKGPVWKVIADSVWTDSSIDRLAYDVAALGLDWAYNKFYKFENDPNSYRPRKMEFNENNYTTKFDLLRLTDIATEFEPETEDSMTDSNGIILISSDDYYLYYDLGV